MSLNHAQREAITHHQGPCLVLAGPGSGKTLTIAKRIEYLIQKLKVRPEEILVITFTKYAVKEMKTRTQRVLQNEQLPVTFGTFHGIYYGILKWAYHLNQNNILTEEERFEVLRQIAGQAEWDGDEDLVQEKDFLADLSEEIGNVKNQHLDIDTYVSQRYGMGRFRKIYKDYEEAKKRMRKIDFEDMLILCYQLFEKHPEVLKRWQNKYKYILIDEFQDVNQIQYDVIKMLAAPENNLFVVGDDDQSIYGFRGAKPDILMEFKRDYPEAKQVLLDINYRSTAHIVNSALRVINHNKMRFPKEIEANQKAEKAVHVQEVKDIIEEADYIYEKIQGDLKAGIQPEDIAVLFRTTSDARLLVEKFMDHGIEFQMKDYLNNIYDSMVGQDIYSYLSLSQKRMERRFFLQIVNRPNRYVVRESMETEPVSYETLRNFYCDKEWMQDRIDQLEWDMKMIENKTPYAAIQYIRKSIGYDEFLKEYASYRQASLEEMKDTLEEIQEVSKGFKTIGEWLLHVEEYKEILKKQSQNLWTGKGISLLTIHGAKGLEYDTVYIISANEGSIPYKKAQINNEIEEERRLFYVAMTRAKRQLVISYVKEKNGKALQPSRFVNELFVIR